MADLIAKATAKSTLPLYSSLFPYNTSQAQTKQQQQPDMRPNSYSSSAFSDLLTYNENNTITTSNPSQSMTNHNSHNPFSLLNKEERKEEKDSNYRDNGSNDKEDLLYSNDLLHRKKSRNSKMCSGCPHLFARHYAKNMCSNCYHSKGRVKKPWNCSHVTKTHYALGLCQNCYQMNYTKGKKDSTAHSAHSNGSQDFN